MSLMAVGVVEPFGAGRAVHWVGPSVKFPITKSAFLGVFARIVTG